MDDVLCRVLCSSCNELLVEERGTSKANAALWAGFKLELEVVRRHVAHGHLTIVFAP